MEPNDQIENMFKNPLDDNITEDEKKYKNIIPGTNLEFFEMDRVFISKSIKRLTRLFRNMRTLSSDKADLYSFRQELVDIKSRLMDMSRLKTSIHTKQKESNMISIRKNGKDGVKPNNAGEMDLMISATLDNIEFEIKTIDHQITHILDSLKTVDQMIYGIEAAITLDQKYGGGMGG